ncbi:hypothetical protein ElyMa_000000200 [Elysia marginata]|uniref:TH1 domain-containing protein n=1 Tax=Elysia marginata TaxID=1093978 RepID=A0AAV4E7R6_9GAST|nr:hypothetical protein ElyMa_000000200 [Elysia marginata]
MDRNRRHSQQRFALKEYFDTCYLKINTTKSVSTAFHLNNQEASKTLNVKVNNKILLSDPNSKYLGVTLDRKLNYRKYLEGCANKIAKSNCILRKLARTTCGASQSVLQTSTIDLCNITVTKLDGGYVTIHNADEDLVALIDKHTLEV